MNQEAQRDLKILTQIAWGENVTQRSLSKSLGIALGLTNLYLKRLVNKGYVKIRTIPPNRLKYLLTPKGIAQKTRLTYEYMIFSFVLYREGRTTLREELRPLIQRGLKRVALYGAGEAAELAYLTAKEVGLEPVAVFADTGEKTFLDLLVRPAREALDADVDRIIVARFGPVDGQAAELTRLGLPREKLIFLGWPGA